MDMMEKQTIGESPIINEIETRTPGGIGKDKLSARQ
jgi:hypothetical protein